MIKTNIDITPIKFDFSKNVELFDYIKGWSILFVILTHCWPRSFRSHILFCTWGQMAVPLFLLISTALFFRKSDVPSLSITINKLFKRVIKPYLYLELAVLIFSLLLGIHSLFSALSFLVYKGGFGPGSYYVPMFVIYSLILPFSFYLFNSTRKIVCFCILIIVISVISILFLPASLYRILPFRYLSLIPLGYIWAKKGICFSILTFLLSIVSFFFLLVFHYSTISFFPIFWTEQPWDYANWICYFWPAFFLPFIFRELMRRNFLNTNFLFECAGKRSLEIFLLQMTLFFWIRRLPFIVENIIVYTIVSLILSFLPIYIYDNFMSKQNHLK